MEIVAEILFTFVGEILLQLLTELLAELGIEAVRHSARRSRRANLWFAIPGVLALGAVAGGITVWLLPNRLLPEARLPGISLVVAPLVTGAVMHVLGNLRRKTGNYTSFLATFAGAALFAFAMSLVRFIFIQRPFHAVV